MNRRQIMKHAASGLAGLAAGYTLIEHSAGESHAAVSMGTLNVEDASKTTQDGSISNIKAELDGQWSYELPAGKSPDTWQVTLKVASSETMDTVAQTSGDAKYLNNNGSWSLSGSVTETDVYSVDDFRAPEGKIRKVTMGLIVVFEVISDSGQTIAQATLEDTATVSITNEAYQPGDYGDASGSGTIIIVE